MIGPRLSMLLMALAPVIGALLAWIFLHENLAFQEILGIVITISGIGWVISEGGIEIPEGSGPRFYLMGVLFGLGGALGQAGGLVASKLGLENDFSAISGNVIRLTSGTAIIWAFTTAQRQAIPSFNRLRRYPRAVLVMTGAVLAGPVVGVWLSLVAVQRAPVGIASTLMSLTPIFLLPVAYFFFKEKIGPRAIIGTVIAFAGTALLFL
jgi:drug/metabolite transporter (DMT)-like permease